MNDNVNDTEQLIRYLDGELEGSELQLLQQQIDGSPGLAAKLESLRLAKEAMKTYGLKKTISSIHGEMMTELNHSTPVRSINIRKWIQYSYRAAAMLLIGLTVAFLFQYLTATPEKLYRNNYEKFELRDSRGTATSALEQPYKEGNPATVLSLFADIKDPQPADYFLRGMAALNTNQPVTAIQSLLQLQQKNNLGNTHFYEEDADYYLAMAYLHNKEPLKARPLFEKIQADKQHAYHSKLTTWFMLRLQRLH